MTALMSLKRLYAAATLLFTSAALALGGCAGTGSYEIDMMPSPEVYEEGYVDPFIGAVPIDDVIELRRHVELPIQDRWVGFEYPDEPNETS